MKITLGSDPELFIYDLEQNKVISSIGLIPGLKGKPYTKGLKKGFGLQIDNILAEFNTPPVEISDTSKDEFIKNHLFMKDWIDKFVKKINPNYTIKCSASELVDPDQLNTPEAQEFGCSPDFNVYTERANPQPEGTKTNLRTTGFHIHIGYPNSNIKDSFGMLKYFDAYIGVPSLLVDRDERRRELYGKAGCFRMTHYGFEYRVLSGYFLESELTLSWLYDRVIKALKSYNNNAPIPKDEVLIDVINSNKVDMVEVLIDKYKL